MEGNSVSWVGEFPFINLFQPPVAANLANPKIDSCMKGIEILDNWPGNAPAG